MHLNPQLIKDLNLQEASIDTYKKLTLDMEIVAPVFSLHVPLGLLDYLSSKAEALEHHFLKRPQRLRMEAV